MRFIALVIIVVLSTIAPLLAVDELSAEARALQQQLTFRITPAIRAWVANESRLAANPQWDENRIRMDAFAQFAGRPLVGADQDALVFLVLNETYQSCRETLRRQQIRTARESVANTATNAPGGTNVVASATEKDKATEERCAKLLARLNELARRVQPNQTSLFQNLR